MRNKYSLWSFILTIIFVLLLIISISSFKVFLSDFAANIGALYLSQGLVVLAFILSITSLVLSIIALVKYKKYQDGKGYAIVSLVVSSLTILAVIVIYISLLSAL